MPREFVFLSSKKSAIVLGVVLDSVDCHNSATTAKSTNDSEEPCQEGKLFIGQNPGLSKCDDDSAGEPWCLKKDGDDKHDEISGVMDDLEILVEIQIVMGNFIM